MREFPKSLFRVTPGLRDNHNYRRDVAHDGRYLMRLPDRTLVPAEDYEKRLAEFLERQTDR